MGSAIILKWKHEEVKVYLLLWELCINSFMFLLVALQSTRRSHEEGRERPEQGAPVRAPSPEGPCWGGGRSLEIGARRGRRPGAAPTQAGKGRHSRAEASHEGIYAANGAQVSHSRERRRMYEKEKLFLMSMESEVLVGTHSF